MTAVGRALSLAEMVHHREQHAESDQHSEPERRSDHLASISSFPISREHILCDWKAPRLGQEIEEISDEMRAGPSWCTSLPPNAKGSILALTWPSDPPAVTACTGARQAVG